MADARAMAVAVALSRRTQSLSAPNPNVGCILIKDGRIVGRGWTAAGGRPHAEAIALAQAGAEASGATAYVTLEPCAHDSARGPACADVLGAAGVARVVIALTDPDPRTNGKGATRLRDAGILVETAVLAGAARAAMAGWLMQIEHRRPHVTLKLATSLDGCIALASGESQWITGAPARAHGHLMRSLCNLIIVGRATYEADAPRLDVRLPGLEARSPQRMVLSSQCDAPVGWSSLARPEALIGNSAHYALVEGGAGAASAFLKADLVDRLVIYRAPILIGGGKAALGDIGLGAIGDAHGRWCIADTRQLGDDRLDIYERMRGI
jgi:diaminohydroxyphosphoribosylaminopyrimidine deaminase / 5-amino-6-(5-phosphoribosylamino)uracil reductase